MFGKALKNSIVISLILFGFCAYIIKLYLQKDINLYIHPRYTGFSVIMSAIALVFLVLGIYFEARKRHIVKPPPSRTQLLDIVVVGVLALAFILPAQALSSKAIGRKSLNTPSYDTKSENAPFNTTCPDTKPASIEMWVYEISQYPINCYDGQPIELTGFVFEAPESPLPKDMYYLGRVVMSCCIIDARPYALPIKDGNFERYPKETWLKVSGKLRATDVNGSIQLVIEPESVVKVDDPSKPYDYINTRSMSDVQPLEPIQ